MKGSDKVIEVLGDVLAAELTAINQYFIHSRMNENWGYKKLSSHMKKESIEEMGHADNVIQRILFLDGVPDLQRYMKITVGKNVEEMMKLDLELEFKAIERLNNGIKIAIEEKDNGSRELLEKILIDEEEHIDWIEAQLTIIKDIGIANYLQNQI